MNTFVYDAFISYSHKDMKWGKWLQRRLENYRIPAAFALPDNLDAVSPGGGTDADGGAAPAGKASLRRHLRIFRDQTDLTGGVLQSSLENELSSSRCLIVICSRNSASSEWVNAEIRHFISLGRYDSIIPFIVDGEPRSDNPELDCYPKALWGVDGRYILGANVQELGRTKALLKILAILLDVRFNTLVNREKARRIRRGAVAAAAVILSGFLIWQNTRISQKNKELTYDIYSAALLSIAQKDQIEAEDVEFLRLSAEAGNKDAMELLADCCLHGWGTEESGEDAFHWYLEAARAGSTVAMIGVSNCYLQGVGTEANPELAFYWDLLAAQNNYPTGMLNLAISYEEGKGTEPDPVKAFTFYEKAAEADSDLGMYNLARCYLNGIGTEQNKEQAFFWMKKLAEWELTEQQKLKNANYHTDGMYNVALMYQYGFGTEEDPSAAFLWYQRAANAGDVNATYMLAWCLENGYGLKEAALDLYRDAADAGNEEAAQAVLRLGGEDD